MPASLPAWRRPLPFLYESTGIETHFTNGLDPAPRARSVFAFHLPDTLAEWLRYAGTATATGHNAAEPAPTFLARLKTLPPLVETGLWPAQVRAIHNLEKSLAANKPRALIQMATGSGKTYTAINFIYRLIKFAGARRVLFLVDRGNLGRQTKKEFDQYLSPYNNFKFGEEYIVQHLTSNNLDTTARVTISTIQRMYSMLKGRELADEDDEQSFSGAEELFEESIGQRRGPSDKARGERAAELPCGAMSSAATRATQDHGLLLSPIEPIAYNPAIPIETFDIIVTDEAHRSIYKLWRQVLEYFDAHLIGLTATPNKQTFGFFNQNLVMEYGHQQAVADGVNVNYDVYRIRTEVTEAGSKVEAGYWLEVRDKERHRLQRLLAESTGKTLPVKPVILFPGWYIEDSRASCRDLWVLEPKALAKFLDNEPSVVAAEDVKLASYHLSCFIREQERVLEARR
ncbi:MAG: DEAD/DEAH box helicase family protein [Rhodocyclaceae bacterium]|nr:DEAD/DEAH box helicase family protein [Rhodocyclaceae bacterium]